MAMRASAPAPYVSRAFGSSTSIRDTTANTMRSSVFQTGFSPVAYAYAALA